MDPNITVNRHVLAGLLNIAEAGQAARAKMYRAGGFAIKARDLSGNADALGELRGRLEAGTIGDVSVSGALDRILTA